MEQAARARAYEERLARYRTRVPDERLAKFLARHAVSARESAFDDVADEIGLSAEASWPVVDAVCRTVADQLSMRPDRASVALERDPPHPSYEVVMKRLRAQYRNPRR